MRSANDFNEPGARILIADSKAPGSMRIGVVPVDSMIGTISVGVTPKQGEM
jgi:hypothetical protein